MKQKIALSLAALALSLPASIAFADAKPASGEQEQQARIPFVNHGGIRNWHAEDRDTLYIEGSNRQWYKAELMGNCIDLDFAHSIGFKTGPTGTFDRFSTIITGEDRCPVKSLVKSGPPPKKGEAKQEEG